MNEPIPTCPDTDDAIMRRVARNDTGAFACLVRRHQGMITGFAARMFDGDLDAGADVAQETFVRLWENRARYAAHGKLTSYLLRIAYNLCASRLRSPAFKAEPLDAAKDTAKTAPPMDVALAVRQALRRLPEEQRVVFLLSEYSGLTYTEIAQTLSIAPGTVASRKHVAVQALRVSLADWAGGE